MAALIVVLLLLAGALVLLRLRARRLERRRRQRRRAAAAARRREPATLVGSTALVIERIANLEGVGCVSVAGHVLTARAYDGERVIEEGEEVEVVEVRGATALVALGDRDGLRH